MLMGDRCRTGSSTGGRKCWPEQHCCSKGAGGEATAWWMDDDDSCSVGGGNIVTRGWGSVRPRSVVR